MADTLPGLEHTLLLENFVITNHVCFKFALCYHAFLCLVHGEDALF